MHSVYTVTTQSKPPQSAGNWLNLALIVTSAIALIAAGIHIFGSQYIDRKLNRINSSSSIAVSEHARRLHQSLLIVDLHSDSLLWNRDLLRRNSRGHMDIPRLIEGNVAIQAFTIVTQIPSGVAMENNHGDSDDIGSLAILQAWPVECWSSLKQRVIYQCRKLIQFSERSNGRLFVLKSKSDLEKYLQYREHNSDCTAGFLGIEGAHALEGDLNNIDLFYEHGVRMMAPTHFADNDIGGSAHGIARGGLTAKGRAMIAQMQTKGMMVDLAHASGKVISDVLEITKAPLVVSHTGVRGTHDSVRNLSDEQLRSIAKTGGVIGIGFWKEAVGAEDTRAIAKAIRHAVAIAGIDHVALGSDFDGATTTPFDVSRLVELTQALIDEGFNDDDIHKIMGQNTLSLLRRSLPAS